MLKIIQNLHHSISFEGNHQLLKECQYLYLIYLEKFLVVKYFYTNILIIKNKKQILISFVFQLIFVSRSWFKNWWWNCLRISNNEIVLTGWGLNHWRLYTALPWESDGSSVDFSSGYIYEEERFRFHEREWDVPDNEVVV
jgi:hypothetical protein